MKMGVKMNFVLSVIALVIAIVGCVLAIRFSFFQPAPLSEEKAAAMIEEKTKTYITEKKVKEIVEGAIAAWLWFSVEEEKVTTTKQEVQSFFCLSTPENTVRSFIEAIILGDSKRAVECWSNILPEYLREFTVGIAQHTFREIIEESPQVKSIFQNPDAVKSMLKTLSYEKEQIDQENFYVWYVTPTGDSSEDSAFTVIKGNGNWKIIMIKEMKYEPIFSKIIEEVK